MIMIYEHKDGFYKKIGWFYPLICCLVISSLLFGALFLSSTIKSNRLRAANDRLTEQLDRATSTCAELRTTISNCEQICRDIDELSGRSITTTRDAIEIIEETRYAVESIEVELGLWDSDSVYRRIDDWLESEGVILNE